MAGWRRAVELVMTDEEIATLTALSRSRTPHPTGSVCRREPKPKNPLHDWCYLELADLEAEPFNSANDGLWTRGPLIRRRIVR